MQDVNKMLAETPDYIAIKRYNNSLKALEERYPDAIPNHIQALALGLTENELELQYQEIISCLRTEIGVSLVDD